MNRLTAILVAIMTFFGNWFGYADHAEINPLKITFASENIAESADITVSDNSAFAFWLTDKSSVTAWKAKNSGDFIELDFGKKINFNTVVLREKTDNVECFKIFALTENGYECIYEQDRIMTYRLCDLDNTETSKIKIELTEINNPVKLSGIEIYNEERKNSDFRVCDYMTVSDFADFMFDALYLADYLNVVTDVTLFSAVSLEKDGSINISVGEEEFAARIEKLRKAAGSNDVKIWCTVLFQFGSGDENYDDNDFRRDFINNNLDKITKNLKAFVEKFNLDGIDFDWEHPTTKEQFASYDKLILKTAEFTKVSVACTTWNFLFGEEAVNAVDHFNVMSYDLFDERGNHSNIYDCGRAAIEKIIKAGVPKSKIFLGIPSYCRPVDRGGYWGSYNTYSDKLGKNSNKIEQAEYKIGEETLTNTVYFNSYTDFRDKTALSLQYGCGGIMIFNMHSDTDFSNENSLHRAVFDALN